jgi:hypothetical protein
MTNTHNTINLQTLRGRTFQGFVEFVDSVSPTNFYRLQERQTATITYDYTLDEHYRDDGIKGVDPAGYNSSISITLKVTSDMFDNTTSSSTANNLTYWISSIDPTINGPSGYTAPTHNPLQVTFVGTITTLSGPSGSLGEKYIHFVVNAVINHYGPITWNPNGGIWEMTISGPILSITAPTRSSHKYSDGQDS